jgi:integrase
MHVLRHSCAVWLLETLKWDIFDVATWLDHSDVQVTKSVYLRGANDVRRLRERYQAPESDSLAKEPRLTTPVSRKLQLMAYAD